MKVHWDVTRCHLKDSHFNSKSGAILAVCGGCLIATCVYHKAQGIGSYPRDRFTIKFKFRKWERKLKGIFNRKAKKHINVVYEIWCYCYFWFCKLLYSHYNFFKIYRNLLICNELDPPPSEKYIKPKLFLLIPLKSLSMNTP